MATSTSFNNPNSAELLPATQQRAKKLYETLKRYAAELAAADELDPAVKERGLAVVSHAAECAHRLLASADRSLAREVSPLPTSSRTEAYGNE